MPIVDRREIEFDLEAVTQIVGHSPRAAAALGLLSTAPTRVACLPEQGQVAFVYGTGNTARSVYLKPEQLGAILVTYCLRMAMPMPRAATKGIRIERASVVLAFKTVAAEACAPKEPERGGGPAPKAVASWSWTSS